MNATVRAQMLRDTYTASQLAAKLVDAEAQAVAQRKRADLYRTALVEIRSGRWLAHHARTLAGDALDGAA